MAAADEQPTVDLAAAVAAVTTVATQERETLFVTNLPELIAASDVSDKAVLSSLAEAVVATLDVRCTMVGCAWGRGAGDGFGQV